MVDRSSALISERSWNVAWKSMAMAALCTLLVLPGAISIARYDFRVIQKDTRRLAKEWIEQHIAPRAKILLDEGGPKLQLSSKNLNALYQLARNEGRVGAFTTHLETKYRYRLAAVREPSYDILEINHPWWLPKEVRSGINKLETEKDLDMSNPLKMRGVMPLAYYYNQGFEYVITHSDKYAKYLKEPKRSQFPSFAQFYQDLKEQAELVKKIEPDPLLRSGPTVEIYYIQTPKVHADLR